MGLTYYEYTQNTGYIQVGREDTSENEKHELIKKNRDNKMKTGGRNHNDETKGFTG